MRAAAIGFFHEQVQLHLPAGVDFYDAARKVDVNEQLDSGRPWVKLYLPSEEGDDHPVETYLVIVDCGASGAEAARATAETIRAGLAGNRRTPSPFRRRRITGMSEGNFYRVQITYQVTRPAH